MDDLLREFVTETNESLDVVDVELVRFEQDPNNAKILGNVFRLVHTIKGTCGFLGLPRLEALAHAAETLMGKFRDGLPATNDAVTLILSTIDRIKQILDSLEREQREPEGADEDLISDLEKMVERLAPAAEAAPPQYAVGTLTLQVLERPLRPGEDFARRSRACVPRNPGRSAGAEGRQAGAGRAGQGRRDQDRQSVDPRHRRYA